MSGPSSSDARPGSASRNCPTGSPPPMTRPCRRRSAMRCSPARSACSSSAGCPASRCRWMLLTSAPGTGGSCRWPRSRCPAPSCSPSPAMRGPSSRRWSPTTLTSAAPTPSRSSSAAGSSTARSAPPGTFKTKVITRGVDITINAFYRHSRIKQYLKDGRALRIETVINSPTGLRVGRRIACLTELQDTARAINSRLLDTERAGQGCVLANPVFERIAHPTLDAAGRRASAMRFGDSRVQALAGALCVTLCAVTGITNRSLRALMPGLLGAPYGMTQACYDLARLRRNGLITRRPHANTYDLTPDGLAFAIFYTKVHDRVLAPLFAAGQPQSPPQLRAALNAIEHHIDQRLAAAR